VKKHLALSQRIYNAAASQEVENVKARHTYLHGSADATSEWTRIWSRSDDCSWAHAFGRMRGFDQVWFGSVTCYDMMAMDNWLKIYEIYPEVGGKDPRPLMEASVHTLVTDIIEIADDGQSARASFITPGVIHSVLTSEGEKYCNVLWERYGSDFVQEGGKWLYLHEHVCPDILTKLDAFNWASEDYARITGQNSSTPPPATLGSPPVTDPGPMHLPYSLLSKPQNTVPWPEPYKTLDNENTYTPFRNLH
jgi:hypothetical protein